MGLLSEKEDRQCVSFGPRFQVLKSWSEHDLATKMMMVMIKVMMMLPTVIVDRCPAQGTCQHRKLGKVMMMMMMMIF